MLKDFTFWETLRVGGPVMALLVFCSIVSIAIILERIFYYRTRARVPRAVFMLSIREHLKRGDDNKALLVCKEASMPFASVVGAGLENFSFDEKEITEAMDRETVIEINNLERRTAIVGTIGSTAVYIGLLGTVWGIIKTFLDIAEIGSSGISVVIRGISEALVCTAAGLLVAIPAVMAYNYFARRVKLFVMDMELCASEAAGFIKSVKKANEKIL